MWPHTCTSYIQNTSTVLTYYNIYESYIYKNLENSYSSLLLQLSELYILCILLHVCVQVASYNYYILVPSSDVYNIIYVCHVQNCVF